MIETVGSSAIRRRRIPCNIGRGTHYPLIRSAASGVIGNSLLYLVEAVFNVDGPRMSPDRTVRARTLSNGG